MGSGASTSSEQKLPEKIPEMPVDLPSPDSKHHISLMRSRSGVSDTDAQKKEQGKRRSSVKSSSSSEEEVFDKDKLMRTPVNPKLNETTKRLVVESIQHFFFPSNASGIETVDHKAEIDLFLKALVRETSQVDSYAMQEGEFGTKLYILESGNVEVTIGGNFIRTMGPGSLFGELALIYDAPRSATIKCTSNCVFWVLSRANYQGILAMTRSHDVTQRLMECPDICNELGYLGRSKLLKSLTVHTYEKNDVIYEQGSTAENVLLIEKGCAIVSCLDDNNKPQPMVYDDLCLDTPEDQGKEKGTTSDTFELTEGCIFGIPAISGHVFERSSGKWKYDTERKIVTCPVRLVAKEKVQCASFSLACFRKLRETYPPDQRDQETLRQTLDNDSTEDFGVINDLDITQMKLHLITSQGSRSAHAIGTYSNGREYSIKYVSKANIIAKSNKEIDEFFAESNMLRTFHSRFIQKMCCVFETPTSVAFVTEELDRGDLFSAIYENPFYPAEEGGIPSELVKFYTSSLASAIAYLHERNIAYRDLKPENCMIDSKGYIKLIEFGFAKKIPFYKKDRWGRKVLKIKSNTICGTPEYMAPEFILCTGNDHGVDLWSLGVLLYEMIQRITPFAIEGDNNVQELFKRITRVKLIASDIFYLDASIDDKMDDSPHARQLIESLLKGNANSRLGYEDCRAILNHPLFADFNVSDVQAGTYESPYLPPQTFLTGINVSDSGGKYMDPSSFFDSMSPKEEKRFSELFKDREMTRIY